MSQPADESGDDVIPADIRAQVMPAVLDELARWGVERCSPGRISRASTRR